MLVNKYVLICREPLRCTYMENASFVNMEPILVPGDKINHTDFVGDQSKLFLTSGDITDGVFCKRADNNPLAVPSLSLSPPTEAGRLLFGRVGNSG